MSVSDEIQRLESELENSKEDLRENFSQITEKIEQTRSELDPSALLQRKALPLYTVAAVLGFVLGYR
jgi:HPt (histidine-containing phosphotransfer) domain-containing protein